MGLELNLSSRNKSSDCSNGCTGETNTQAAASDWRSASAWSSSTGAAYGLSGPRLAEDRHSVSRFQQARRRSPRAAPERPVDPEPSTVLLVEDNPTDVFVIKEVLDGSGLNLRLRVANNGQDALSYLHSENDSCPSLVLLDLNLPKVAGIEVLKQLRTGSRCKCTPVIVLTSSTAETDRTA